MTVQTMLPKWGHWFWITALAVGLSGFCSATGRGGIGLNPIGILPHPETGFPVPVFIRPDVVSGGERLTIVTPSSVVRNPEVLPTSGFEARRTGLGRGRQLEEDQASTVTPGPDLQVSTKTEEDPDTSDVSISKSVSVVSVKYSLSGARARLDESGQHLTDTSIPPTPVRHPSTTTAATTTTAKTSSAAAATAAPILRVSPQIVELVATATSSPADLTTTADEITPVDATAATDVVHNRGVHVVQKKATTPETTQHTTTVETTTAKSSTTTTTPATTTATPATTTTTAKAVTTSTTSRTSAPAGSSFKSETTTQKFDARPPITSNQPTQKFVVDDDDDADDARIEVGQQKAEAKEFQSETASEFRNEKSLFPAQQNFQQQQQTLGKHLNLTLTLATPATSTTARSTASPTTTAPTARPTATTTAAATSTTAAHLSRTTTTTRSTTTTPQKIYIQEVEEITDVDDEVPAAAASGGSQLERKALHSNVPNSRQLFTEPGNEKAASFGQTSQHGLGYETTEANDSSKMVVEYLEEAELARSFPSTKWNVYEDKDGSWYLQKTATKSSPRPELRHSESPMNQGRNDSVVEYDDLPRVVDVGDSGLSLPDLGDSDRDEEPYEKFMAEESGRSASGAVNDEYVDDAKDDDLTPTYDERNYTDDVDTSPIEPRMLSTAQKPIDPKHQRRDDDVIDEWGQPKVRKPPISIDIATVVGITVGAFLFILIGTVGLGAFIYHEKYMNKPQTLEDRYSSSSDSDGSSVEDPYRRISQIDCIGFDTTRDTFCEEMYNLDNDSFLNSLETVNVPSTSYWIRDSRNVDSDV